MLLKIFNSFNYLFDVIKQFFSPFSFGRFYIKSKDPKSKTLVSLWKQENYKLKIAKLRRIQIRQLIVCIIVQYITLFIKLKNNWFCTKRPNTDCFYNLVLFCHSNTIVLVNLLIKIFLYHPVNLFSSISWVII